MFEAGAEETGAKGGGWLEVQAPMVTIAAKAPIGIDA
jgi:hypothetical protein